MKRFLCPIFLCLIFFQDYASAKKDWDISAVKMIMVLFSIEQCVELDEAYIDSCSRRCLVPDNYMTCVTNQTKEVLPRYSLKYDVPDSVITDIINAKRTICAEKAQKFRWSCAPSIACAEFDEYLNCLSQYLYDRSIGFSYEV